MKQRSRMEILSRRLQLGHTPSLGLLHKDAGNWSTPPLQCKGNSAEESREQRLSHLQIQRRSIEKKKKKTKRLTPMQVFNVGLTIKEEYTGALPQTPHPCADIAWSKAS